MRRTALAACLLGACASVHGADVDRSTDAGVSPDGGREDIALLLTARRVECARMAACISESDGRSAREAVLRCGPWLQSDLRLVADGLAHVDVNAARACVEALSRLPPCPLREPQSFLGVSRWSAEGERAAQACDGALVEDARRCGAETCGAGDACVIDQDCVTHCAGLPGPGEACGGAGECRGIARCDGGTCTAGCTWATCGATGRECDSHGDCVPWPAIGRACSTSPGSYCGLGQLCTADGVCAAVVSNGERCDALARCDDTTFCGDAGVCEPLRGSGAPCTSSASCVDGSIGGTWCDSVTHVCAPTGATFGQPCDLAVTPCAWPLVCAGTSCVGGGGCPFSNEGCGPGFFCNGAPDGSPTCIPDADGSLCESRWYGDEFEHDSCPSGLQCVSNVCRRSRPLGDTCDDTHPCVAGTRCRSGVCRITVLPWEACSDGAPCLPGFDCVAGACVEGPPLAPHYVGDACADGTCERGRCVDGTCEWVPVGETCRDTLDCPGCTMGVCQYVVAGMGNLCSLPGVACATGLACTWGHDDSRCCPPP